MIFLRSCWHYYFQLHQFSFFGIAPKKKEKNARQIRPSDSVRTGNQSATPAIPTHPARFCLAYVPFKQKIFTLSICFGLAA